jgi:hypothetical protein
VYCAFEGGKGFSNRVGAFRKEFLAKHTAQVPFFLLPVRVDLIREHQELIEAIRAQVGEDPPSVVVLDTLNRSLIGSESNDADMAAYIAAADALRGALHCAVIIVHHCGYDQSHPRGHTSLSGADDAEIAVKEENGVILLQVELMRDGPSGDVIASRLRIVDLGLDKDGTPVTSCVVAPAEPVEYGASGSTNAKPACLPKAARTALRALQEALIEAGEEAPASVSGHVSPGVRVVTVELWRKYAYQRGISASDEPRAKQTAFKRASEYLIGAGEVVVWEPYVWTRRPDEQGGEHTNTP